MGLKSSKNNPLLEKGEPVYPRRSTLKRNLLGVKTDSLTDLETNFVSFWQTHRDHAARSLPPREVYNALETLFENLEEIEREEIILSFLNYTFANFETPVIGLNKEMFLNLMKLVAAGASQSAIKLKVVDNDLKRALKCWKLATARKENVMKTIQQYLDSKIEAEMMYERPEPETADYYFEKVLAEFILPYLVSDQTLRICTAVNKLWRYQVMTSKHFPREKGIVIKSAESIQKLIDPVYRRIKVLRIESEILYEKKIFGQLTQLLPETLLELNICFHKAPTVRTHHSCGPDFLEILCLSLQQRSIELETLRLSIYHSQPNLGANQYLCQHLKNLSLDIGARGNTDTFINVFASCMPLLETLELLSMVDLRISDSALSQLNLSCPRLKYLLTKFIVILFPSSVKKEISKTHTQGFLHGVFHNRRLFSQLFKLEYFAIHYLTSQNCFLFPPHRNMNVAFFNCFCCLKDFSKVDRKAFFEEDYCFNIDTAEKLFFFPADLFKSFQENDFQAFWSCRTCSVVAPSSQEILHLSDCLVQETPRVTREFDFLSLNTMLYQCYVYLPN